MDKLRKKISFIISLERDIYILKSCYVFEDEKAVINHVKSNPHLIRILQGISANILNHFQKDDTLALGVFKDPEDPEPEYIVIKIITSPQTEDPFENLQAFMEDWYYDNVDYLHVNIIFDFDYK
ncbi:MAG: hypothetical protein GF315_05775 [candidate division Zixibacteria bacterium]|nr:hypothetical protein [candidate division Zixibacteria bacterium]